MAFGDRTALGSVANKDASTTRTITTTATAPAGRPIVLGVSGRDSTGAGLAFAVTDSAGNSYTEIEFVTGTSNMSAFICENPIELPSGGTITISGCESGQAVAAGAISCEGIATSSALESQNDGQGSSDGTTSGDISYVGTNGDELWIGFMSVASQTAGTDDADYSTADIAVTTTGGTVTQNRSMRMQGRVVTGALTDNYNGTTGGTQNRICAVISLRKSSGATVVPVAATAAHTVAPGALSQIHALVSVLGTQGHTVAAPGFTFSAVTLIPVDVIAGHLVASPALAQSAILKMATATQGHTIASPALLQLNILPVAVDTQGHTVAAPDVVQSSLLISVSGTQGHNVAASALLQQNIQRVANAIAGHVADPSSFPLTTVITAVNAITGHTVQVGMLQVFVPGQSSPSRIYAVLEDGRVYLVQPRNETLH